MHKLIVPNVSEINSASHFLKQCLKIFRKLLDEKLIICKRKDSLPEGIHLFFSIYNELKTQTWSKAMTKKKLKQEQDVDFTAAYINLPIVSETEWNKMKCSFTLNVTLLCPKS